MRIMLDTNILISIAIFHSNTLKELLVNIIEELKDVVKKKFPNQSNHLNQFLYQIPYELNYIPLEVLSNCDIRIRDKKDLPILHSAILSDVDIFITGDKDFKDISIEKPEILTASEFLEKY